MGKKKFGSTGFAFLSHLFLVDTRWKGTGGNFQLSKTATRLLDPGLVAWEILGKFGKGWDYSELPGISLEGAWNELKFKTFIFCQEIAPELW